MQYEAGVRAALDEVLAKGRQDGNEHAVIVRDGKSIWRGDGERDMVNVYSAPRGPGNIGVHNHPDSLNSLSSGDLSSLFRHDIDAIYAISGDDGSVYKASQPAQGWGQQQWAIAFDRVRSDLVDKRQGYHYFGMNDQSRYFNSAHWINRLMDSVGVFKYEYELGEVMRKKTQELDQRLEFPRLIENFRRNVEGRLELLTPEPDFLDMVRMIGFGYR